jgi:hypothetical protein
LCYAKITPAALQRGWPRARSREGAEAVGSKPKFELSDLQPGVAEAAEKVVEAPGMAAS